MAISSWEWPEELGSCSADWRSPRPGACNAEKPPALRNGGGWVYRIARWQVSKGAVSAVAGPGVRGGGTSGAHAFGKLSLFSSLWGGLSPCSSGHLSPACSSASLLHYNKIHCRRPVPESLYFASHARFRSSAFPRRLPGGRPSTPTPPRRSDKAVAGEPRGSLSPDDLLLFFWSRSKFKTALADIFGAWGRCHPSV